MDDSLEKEFPQLVEQLSKPNGIVDLADKNSISVEKLGKILERLRNNVTVTTLDLSRSEIGDEHCKIISDLLKENTAIKELNLNYNPMMADGINTLSVGLKQNEILEKLCLSGVLPLVHFNQRIDDFSCNPLVKAPMEEIGSLLSSPDCKIGILLLENNLMRADGAKFLGNSLSLNNHLTKLSLYRNELDDVACMEICEGLKNNSTLTCLELLSNKIGVIGGKSLACVLSSPNCALEELDISNNPIEEGMSAIFESLIRNNKLKELRMAKTGKKSGCLKQLGGLFQKNKTMSEYRFDDFLGESVLLSIANTMSQNTAIKQLSLSDCGLTHIALTKILQALTTNTILNQLSLCETLDSPFQDIGLLAEAIKKNTTLEELWIMMELAGDPDQIMSLRKAAKINHSIHLIYFNISVRGEKVRVNTNHKGSMRSFFRRNEAFQNSGKAIDKTFVGHHISPEFVPCSDILVEFV